ncbi:zinc finger, AN1-type domain [Coemansia sp. RSA 518]|nr:zinc finger, AN1-type domain [Coemansia sp. RSA 518]KAJ2283566.1 zinc finger, AN1-type domain [Coemansia sp. RSA 370]
MQRSTCASDNLDCQCTWASEATLCFAPCVAEKEFSDGMHAAHGDQETVCAQAAKFGQAAKDKERLKQDEKKNKGKKQEKEVWTTTGAKDMNDLNDTHDSVRPEGPKGQAKPAGPKHVDAESKPKKTAGGDKDVNMVESAAPAVTFMVPGILVLLASILTIYESHWRTEQHLCERTDLVVDRRVPSCPICNQVISLGPDDNPDTVVDRHIAQGCKQNQPKPKRNGCLHKGCKLKAVAFDVCPECEHKYCITHLHTSAHDCQGRPQRRNDVLSVFAGKRTPTPSSRRPVAVKSRAAKSKDTGCICA